MMIMMSCVERSLLISLLLFQSHFAFLPFQIKYVNVLLHLVTYLSESGLVYLMLCDSPCQIKCPANGSGESKSKGANPKEKPGGT